MIPGHGKYGGQELIDYTINLYDTTGRDWILNQDGEVEIPSFGEGDILLIKADQFTKEDSTNTYKNATIYMQDDTKFVKIESFNMIKHSGKSLLDINSGRVEIYDKVGRGGKLRIGLPYKRLIVINRDDSIGLVVILKAFGE